MKRFATFTFALCGLLSAHSATYAAPSAIGLGSFSGSETLINFNTRSDEELIDTQYVGQGVTFGGALYGMTNIGDLQLFPGNGGGVIASNWLYSQGQHQGTSFTATFASLQRRVGFYASTNFADDATISVEIGGNPQGSVFFNTVSSATFVGVEDLAGFNSITVTASGPDNNFISIDDFRFEGIPEPSTFLIAITSFGLLTMCGFPRRRRCRTE